MPKKSTLKAIVVRAPKGVSRSNFLDAAYQLTDRAWVRVDESGGKLSAFLTPRFARGGELACEFKAACAAAKLQSRGAPAATALRAAILTRALELAEHMDARWREALPELPSERLAEIAALLSETEGMPADPLGLRVPWDERRG